MRPLGPSVRLRRSGFTLVELMVVLLLIGILTAVIIPEMRGTFEDALLRSTARKLVRTMNLAYSQAITINQPHRLILDVNEGRFWIERDSRPKEGGIRPVRVREISGAAGDLDKRVSIEIVRPGEDEENGKIQSAIGWSEEPNREARGDAIVFRTDGTSDPVELRLRDRAGFGLGLRVNPTTSRVRIRELEPERRP